MDVRGKFICEGSMTTESATALDNLIRKCDLGWMIDMYYPQEQALPHLLRQLTRLTDAFRAQFGYECSFDPETLARESERNPHTIRAFLQALAATGKVEMLLMVWRILQGLSIRRVELSYVEKDRFQLVITLALPDGDSSSPEVYESDDINDAKLLRHFGITTIDGRPLFDGFFPLRNR